jgi:hypothetical protein
MKTNPIIDEVRRVRTELSDELGNDPQRFLEYFSALREKHLKEGRIYITPPNRNSELKENSPTYQVTETKKNSQK